MDENKFQKLLHDIVHRTLPTTLLAGALVFSPACSCQAPHEDSSCPEPFPTCSLSVGTKEKPKIVHRYRKIVSSPLTFEQCQSLCYRYAAKVCPSQPGPNETGNPYASSSPSVVSCSVGPHIDGQQILECEYTISWGCSFPGRRPDGLEESNFQTKLVATHRENVIGGYLARAAHCEAAAVVAFEYLTKELAACDAPAALQKMAQEAILEETQHAEIMGMLALAHGGSLLPVEVEPFRTRSLFEIACENVVEGCYNETMSALSVLWQSIHAKEEEMREIFARIAHDETRHATLSWGLDAWMQSRLSAEEQEKLTQIKQQAFAKLKRDFSIELSEELRDVLGLPTAAQSIKMLEQLEPNFCS